VREKAERERERAEKERERLEKERERAELKAEREREKAEREREKAEREWERVEREREERDLVEREHPRQQDEPVLKPAKSLKRASRKLSFSAIPVTGIFSGGFGKKDRDRDTVHPSSLPPPTTIHAIAASGPPPARTPRSPERQPERTAIRIETQPRFGF